MLQWVATVSDIGWGTVSGSSVRLHSRASTIASLLNDQDAKQEPIRTDITLDRRGAMRALIALHPSTPIDTHRQSRGRTLTAAGPVAQLDRARDFESRGCRFKFCRDRQLEGEGASIRPEGMIRLSCSVS